MGKSHPREMPFSFVLLALFLSSAGASLQDAPVQEVELRDDLQVTADIKIRPGVYRIPDQGEPGIIQILASDITVDMTGVRLFGNAEDATPDQFQGTGVLAGNVSDVTLKGGKIHGFRFGIRWHKCTGGTIQDMDWSDNHAQKLKSTPEKMDEGDWLEIRKLEPWYEYGAGLWLEECEQVKVLDNYSRRTQNGIILVRSQQCRILRNDCSYCSGWGIALYASERNIISKNRFDFCVRGESWGKYSRGCDSAGILLVVGSSNNRVTNNSATHGGDGFFLTSGPGDDVYAEPSNNNFVSYNNFSHSPHNAIEATFSTGNRFQGNRCDDSDYGFWLGYSRKSEVAINTMHNCVQAGVAIEWGSENRIHQNLITRTRGPGVWLWKRENKLNAEQEHVKNRIEKNKLYYNEVGLRIHHMTGGRLAGNHSVANLWEKDLQWIEIVDLNFAVTRATHRNVVTRTKLKEESKAAGYVVDLNKPFPQPLEQLIVQFHWSPLHDRQADLLELEGRTEKGEWIPLQKVHGQDWPLLHLKIPTSQDIRQARIRLLTEIQGFDVVKVYAGKLYDPAFPEIRDSKSPPVAPPGANPPRMGRRHIRIGPYYPLPVTTD